MIENWPTDGIKYVEEVREKTKVTLKDKIEIFDNQKYFMPITIMQKVDGEFKFTKWIIIKKQK